jgi:hypothetical protein
MMLFLSIALAVLTQMPAPALPDGNGSWLIEVVTSGGFTGAGIGSWTLSSQGALSCPTELQCPKNFNASALQSLIDPIRPEIFAPPQKVSITAICSDCITRTLTITQRDSKGIVRIHTVSWNEVNRSQVPQEVLRLYDAMLTLLK